MPLSRRDLLRRTGLGLGGLALAGLADDAAASPTAPKPPHFPAKAKRVIQLFMNGGVSQVDTFDPKPLLAKYAGKPLPTGSLQTERKTGAALPSPWKFTRHGQSGLAVSEIFPHTAKHADELCVVRSMVADLPNHEPSLLLWNCGDPVMARPSLGSWLTYGLGTENQNLPGFVAFCPGGLPIKGAENWQAGFLPGAYQGTYIDTKHTAVEKLIENVRPLGDPAKQRKQLDLLAALNRDHQAGRADDPRLEARIQSFELAYRMQAEAADAFDIGREPKHIRESYGDTVHGRELLIARRLVERGVRMVQVWHGPVQPWDDHGDILHHGELAKEIDQPIGALLTDLKRLGLLQETLVVWGGEFGRTPVAELPAGRGRDHNPYGFTVWLAGGGVMGGTVVGATDEFGFKAVENKVHVRDLHATVLHLMGFDHEKLTYRYAGRDFRLTDVHGRVVKEVLA